MAGLRSPSALPHRRERGGRGRAGVPQLKGANRAERGFPLRLLARLLARFPPPLRTDQDGKFSQEHTGEHMRGSSTRSSAYSPTTTTAVAGSVSKSCRSGIQSGREPIPLLTLPVSLDLKPTQAQPRATPVVSLRRGAARAGRQAWSGTDAHRLEL